jgi:hypothetical protein
MQTSAAVSNFTATGELASSSTINSFALNASGNSGTASPVTAANSLHAGISGVNMTYRLKN